MNSAQRVIELGPSESACTPFWSVTHTLGFLSRYLMLSAKCPPVCSSWNCPMRNTGTFACLSHGPGARCENSDGVRNGFCFWISSAFCVCRRSFWLAMQCLSPCFVSMRAYGWPPAGAGFASSMRSCTQVFAKPELKMPPG